MSSVIGWREELQAMVDAQLPAMVAHAFAQLPLRAAVRLSAARPGDPVVGHLGGAARLPVGTSWPLVRGRPLLLVASLDCAAVGANVVDIELPDSGRLLFFLPHLEEMEILFGDNTPPPPVIYVPEGTRTAEHRVPDHLRRDSPEEYDYPLVPLTGRTIASAPRAFSPALGENLDSIRALSDTLWYNDYNGTSVDRVIAQYRGPGPGHQVGGYSDAFQQPLEVSAAYHARQSRTGSNLYDDPTFLAEAREWVTLLQIGEDTDARMIWGDGAIALWAIRRDDLARRDFGSVYFTVDGH
jgi:uncharacterized protein YwqG